MFAVYVVGFCWLNVNGRITHKPIYPFATRGQAREMARKVLADSAAEWQVLPVLPAALNPNLKH